MKKILVCVIVAIIPFLAGWRGCSWYYNVDGMDKIIQSYERLDSLTWKIMDKHGIPDIDGSDDMSDLLKNYEVLDSLHENL